MPTYRGRDNATVRQQGVHAGERSGARTPGRMARPDSSPTGSGRVMAHSSAGGPPATAEGAQATQAARQARAFSALVQAFPERVETISPKRGATSSPGARWPRPGQGNAVGAAGFGVTSHRSAHTRPVAEGARRCACVRARACGMGGRPGACQRRGGQGAPGARDQTGGRHAGARSGPAAGGGRPGWRSRKRIGSCSSHFRSNSCRRGHGASASGQGSRHRARAEACTGERGRRGRHGACGARHVRGTERARGSERWRQ